MSEQSEVLPPTDDIYEESEADGTDNEEETLHDSVFCTKCEIHTHVSNGKCGTCGDPFKMSRSGYLLTGEDGEFLCDEDEEIVYESGGSSDEDELDDDEDGSDEDESDSSSEDSIDPFCEEDDEYAPKGEVSVPPTRTPMSRGCKRVAPYTDCDGGSVKSAKVL